MVKQSDETKIALIQKDVEYIKQSQNRMEVSMNELKGIYVTQQEYKDKHLELLEKMDNLDRAVKSWKWLTSIAGFILGSVLTFLIYNFLTNLAAK